MRRRTLWLVVCFTFTIAIIILNTSWDVTYDWGTDGDKGLKELPLRASGYDVVPDVRGQEAGSFRYTTVDRSDTTYPPHTSHQSYNKEEKKVLLVYNNNPEHHAAKNFTFKTCEYSACAMIFDLKKADLVMVDGVKTQTVTAPCKYPGQIWLMYAGEPPSTLNYGENRTDLIDKFNWTKTVHQDSTFWNSYGHLVLRETLPQKDYKSIYRNKIYDVAWFVSHCTTKSKREEYVRRMMSVIDVHIFGACGNLTCGGKKVDMDGELGSCYNMLSQNYKFYLSFENTLCEGYVSEKFFNMFKGPGVDVIPVVRNGADNLQMFPPGISIISSDFPSPESLGKYLYSLARDEERYINMLKNKDRYTTGKSPLNFECELCKALHLRQPVNVYHDIVDWLHRPDMCWPPNDL